MSVNLLIEYKNPTGKMELVPVSGQTSFRNYWLPICSKLNLTLMVRAYHSSLDILGVLPDLLEELQRLKEFVAQSSETELDPYMAERIIEKVDILTEEMEHIRENPSNIEYAVLG
jgi:hypothetical protein